MITLVFETHSTSADNEMGVASGHLDVDLSGVGVRQAADLGRRYEGALPDAVYCSDLRRSYRTGELAFGRRLPIHRDPRLRECDYGEMSGRTAAFIQAEKPGRVERPFPGGESYRQREGLMRDFLDDLRGVYADRDVRIVVIGHRATQYSLESLLNGRELAEVVTAPWAWQPGWVYRVAGRSCDGA